MGKTFVVIYTKDRKIKVLNLDESVRLNDSIIKDGWIHTQTLDACVFIEYLHNECDSIDLIEQILSLSKYEFKLNRD